MKRSISGFTIVELLIVIVVIAILAAISIVAYTGIQARANDAKMRAGVKQFETTLRIWVQDHSLPIYGGYGSTVAVINSECSDGDGGYIAGNYLCTVNDALVSAQLLPSGFMRSLPLNTQDSYSETDGRYSTMLYSCGSGLKRYGLYWTLRSPTAEDTISLEDTLTTCGNNASNVRDVYGMRAGKILQF